MVRDQEVDSSNLSAPTIKSALGVKCKVRGNKRVHLFYSGRVQGIGFRFTTENIALSVGVVGWVKNLPDGRVEVVAEAEEARLVQFLERVRNGPMKPYIRGVESDWSEATEEYRDFSIRF